MSITSILFEKGTFSDVPVCVNLKSFLGANPQTPILFLIMRNFPMLPSHRATAFLKVLSITGLLLAPLISVELRGSRNRQPCPFFINFDKCVNRSRAPGT